MSWPVRWQGAVAVCGAVAVALAGCAGRPARENRSGWVIPPGSRPMVASWYGGKFHGRKTASGEVFNKRANTAAHKTLPFGTQLKVTNPRNGRAVVIRITDRGPFIRGRDLDLAEGAADRIGFVPVGVGTVYVEDVRSGGFEADELDPTEPASPELGQTATVEGGDGMFTVQAGSFREPSFAAQHQEMLARTYADVVVERAGGVHRVLVGRFATREEAEQQAERLRADGVNAAAYSLDALRQTVP